MESTDSASPSTGPVEIQPGGAIGDGAPTSPTPDGPETAVAGAAAPHAPAHEGPAPRTAKEPKRRPCFHCGTMTSVTVLEKTGDLCWRCYRPVGYSILKGLLAVSVLLVLAAGLILGWRFYWQEEDTGRRTAQDFKPREFSADEKITILTKHFVDEVPIAELCTQYELAPSEFRRWKQQFIEAGRTAFEQAPVREPNASERRFTRLETKLQAMSTLLAEMREALDQLRKDSGLYAGDNPTESFITGNAPPPPREK